MKGRPSCHQHAMTCNQWPSRVAHTGHCMSHAMPCILLCANQQACTNLKNCDPPNKFQFQPCNTQSASFLLAPILDRACCLAAGSSSRGTSIGSGKSWRHGKGLHVLPSSLWRHPGSACHSRPSSRQATQSNVAKMSQLPLRPSATVSRAPQIN
jgi:hypothetical protein